MSEQTYSIKDLEDISGIKTHTLRAWERRYKIFTPSRTSTNIRFYSDADLKKLLSISILLKNGVRISQAALLNPEELKEKVRVYGFGDSDTVIDSLIIDMIEFNQFSFEKNLNRAIFNLGFEEAVKKVIYPFFNKVGILWLTNSINPAQEHFVSSIIIQKFFLAIDSLDQPKSSAKSFILYLPERELHELGLLLSYYLVRKFGHKAIYLGQNMPMADVIKALNSTKADYLLTHFTSLFDKQELYEYLDNLSKESSPTTVFVSGNQINSLDKLPGNNIEYLSGPAALIDRLGKV